MPTYEFRLVLGDSITLDESLAERLFEAGCDDGTLFSSEGVATVGFAREADSLEDAVRSAVRDVMSTGVRVARVESSEDRVYSQINAELATR